jgi:hypothetical protein
MPTPRPIFPLSVGGAIGGLCGAFLGHLAVVGVHKIDPAASLWLKGSHGPPFFSLLLNVSVAYACIGAGVFRGRQRLMGAAWGGGSVLLGMALVLGISTRLFTWGEGPGAQQTLAWFYLVLGTYTLASTVAVWLIGAKAQAGSSTHDFKAGWGAVAGAAVAYAIGVALNRLIPALAPSFPPGVLPHVGALTDGVISGAAIGAGTALLAVNTGDKSPQAAAPNAPGAAPRAA